MTTGQHNRNIMNTAIEATCAEWHNVHRENSAEEATFCFDAPQSSGQGEPELTEARRTGGLVAALAAVTSERDAYLRQLTSVQAECTRLTLVNRALRKDLVPLAERLVEAREKHPEGCHLVNLHEERDEVEYAIRFENEARIDSELLDEAVCCVRLTLGGDAQ